MYESYSLMKSIIKKLYSCSISAVLIILLVGCSKDDTPQSVTIPAPIKSEQDTPSPSPQVTQTQSTDQQAEPVSARNDYLLQYTSVPPEDDRWITFGSYRAPRPTSWVWSTPKSTRIVSNYILPGISGVDKSDPALLTIVRFDSGEGGSLETNIYRWERQFRSQENAPIQPTIQKIQVNGKEATIVEIHGEFMGTGATWHLRDQTLLVVIVEEETDMLFFKYFGASITIDAHRDTLQTFLGEMELIPSR